MLLFFNLYLNITSLSQEAKQVLFLLPDLPTIFCIYLYILSIERLGLCGVGGLPTPSSHTLHPPTVGHIYLYPYITISLYPYSMTHLTYCLSHLLPYHLLFSTPDLPTCSSLSIYTCFPYVYTPVLPTRFLYLILLLSRNFFTPIPPSIDSRIKNIT